MGSSEPLGNSSDFIQINTSSDGVTPDSSSSASFGTHASASFGTHASAGTSTTAETHARTSATAGTTFGLGPGTGTQTSKATEESPSLGKRRRPLTEDEVGIMNGLTSAMHMVAEACKAPVVVHKPEVPPNLYSLCMSTPGFTKEDLMLALNHLMNHKLHGEGFVLMSEPHRILWIRQYLAKLRAREATADSDSN